jgi:hypothetical protein
VCVEERNNFADYGAVISGSAHPWVLLLVKGFETIGDAAVTAPGIQGKAAYWDSEASADILERYAVRLLADFFMTLDRWDTLSTPVPADVSSPSE